MKAAAARKSEFVAADAPARGQNALLDRGQVVAVQDDKRTAGAHHFAGREAARQTAIENSV